MTDNIITLQIINIILTALAPVILSFAYCVRHISKSRCCNRAFELDIRKDSFKKNSDIIEE